MNRRPNDYPGHNALTAVVDISGVLFCFSALAGLPREIEQRNENGVREFNFFGRCGVFWDFLGGGWNNCIAARGWEEGGGCLYIRVLLYI